MWVGQVHVNMPHMSMNVRTYVCTGVCVCCVCVQMCVCCACVCVCVCVCCVLCVCEHIQYIRLYACISINICTYTFIPKCP